MADGLGDDSSNGSDDAVVHTPGEIRRRGLLFVNCTKKRLRKAKTKRNDERFKGHFGCFPVVLAKMWKDLQTEPI